MTHPYPLFHLPDPEVVAFDSRGQAKRRPRLRRRFFRPCKGRICVLATAEEFDAFSVEISNPRMRSGGVVPAGRDLPPAFQDQPFRLTGDYGPKQLFSLRSTMGAERFTCG
jgi:hypothetical protein